MADVGIVHDHRQVAAHLQLVAPADAGSVDACDGRLADVAQPVMHLDEGAHPAPVLAAGGAHLGLLVEIGTGAEGAVAGTGDDHHGHGVVPARVLERATELAQCAEIEGVEHLRPIDGDRRHASTATVTTNAATPLPASFA